jgi:hypothetical protein
MHRRAVGPPQAKRHDQDARLVVAHTINRGLSVDASRRPVRELEPRSYVRAGPPNTTLTEQPNRLHGTARDTPDRDRIRQRPLSGRFAHANSLPARI